MKVSNPFKDINLGKIKDDFNLEKFLLKSFYLISFLILITVVISPLFNEYVLPILIQKSEIRCYITDLTTIVLSIIVIVFSVLKFKNKYQPSYSQFLFFSSLLIIYGKIRLDVNNFDFYTFKTNLLSKVYYVDVIFFSILIFPICHIVLLHWLKRYFLYKTDDNIYSDDNSNEIDIDDENMRLIHKTFDVITKNKFNGSFSIGLIGSWGHGKTTFLNGLKNKFKNSEISRNYIEINFSPFLNHKEEDIINEFFTSFSSQLSVYSGKLSKSINQYAVSISKAVKRGDLKDLLSKNSFINDKSAFELYTNINEQIYEINKKIIVYIDDLDRLSTKEIIQVFKLIRNVSNFRNTFFIVAIDKSYVVNSLISDKNFLESNYIDKFFQLEIFLPQITKFDLIEYLCKLLTKAKIDKSLIQELKTLFKSGNILFEDYIKNYRDCKKLANQLIFEKLIDNKIFKEIRTEDYINLILFKQKFSVIYLDLLKNRQKYLSYENRIYRLMPSIEKIENKQSVNIRDLKNNDFINLKKYELNDILDVNKTEVYLNQSEKELIIKTFITLFDQYTPAANSIMHIRNYNKIISLKFASDDLTQDEFSQLLGLNSDKELFNFIDKLNSKNSINQLLEKFKSNTFNNKNEILITYKTLLYCISKQEQFKLDLNFILFVIQDLLNGDFEYYEHKIYLEKIEISTFLNEIYFDKNEISSIDKAVLLERISIEMNQKFVKWELDSIFFKNKGDVIIKEYLDKYSKNLWNINDYTFYGIFHRVKNYIDTKQFKEQFIEFLNNKNINIFLSQSLDVEAISYNLFKISEFVLEIFENFEAFKKFVELHKDKEQPYLQEYIEFLKIQKIVNYNIYFKYNFNALNGRLNQQIGSIDIENTKRVNQLLLKFNISESEQIKNIELSFNVRSLSFPSKNERYKYYVSSNVESHTMIQEIYEKYLEVYENEIDETKCNFDLENNSFQLAKKDKSVLVEVVTFQFG